MKKLFAVFALVMGMVSAAYADDASPSASQALQALSAWTNQSGSILFIDQVAPNGQMTGRYINRAAGYHCQNIPYPVTGWIYPNQTGITFTTLWKSPQESCNSITSWTGFYYNGKISTLWQLVVNGSTNTGQILQGSDTFMPSQMSEKKSLLK